MKKLITILFALTLLIVGCGKNAGEKFAEKMASKIAEKAVEAGSGEDVDIDISGDGENGSITIKG
ncbi:MAG: hypothetical protein U9N76_05925, partial [Candidatus Marinimicrobia bacterium]|nr:hypothetical protein [Candidatus Neomarinimicrobiota bacterium]